MRIFRILSLLALTLLSSPAWSKRESGGLLRVISIEGGLRLFRFETEPWPLESGARLPDNSRVELTANSMLRLRLEDRLDFALAGPARLTAYAIPVPAGAEGKGQGPRLVLKLDEGSLLIDGRLQFGRAQDVVLSLPDLTLPLPTGVRLVARTLKGKTELFVPQEDDGEPRSVTWDPVTSQLKPSLHNSRDPKLSEELWDEFDRPIPIFVVGRDYNRDLGLWPRPAVLAPMLVETLGELDGLVVVEGSGDTYFAAMANNALKTGQDFFVREMAAARDARWVVVGNCVAQTLADSPSHGEPKGRRLVGQAEVRVLEVGGTGEELVNEQATTIVARAGRPLELAGREAFEAASLKVSKYVAYQLENLAQGRQHAPVLLRLVFNNVDQERQLALRRGLASMDSVQRVFKRVYAAKSLKIDLILRKDEPEFWAQLQAWRWSGFSLRAQPDEEGAKVFIIRKQ